MTIKYKGRNAVYVNMTNKCPCSCTFCLRHNKDYVFDADSLWLEREPSVKEVCDSIDGWDLSKYDEVVFCGYGEPTERLDELLEVADYIKAKDRSTKIRINTNGLADLIHGEKTAHKLKGLIDTVSISLNATNKEDYFKIVRPKFGMDSYDAMLAFTRDCVAYVPEVVMTVVDVVTTKEEQERSRKICESTGATFRIRPYESN